jgi:DNA-directed RNA polymerase I, II, and III subunit RPABC5
VLADKYQYYTDMVRKQKMNKQKIDGNGYVDRVEYLTHEFNEKTPEGIVMDELNLTRMCCRRHMLTHVDID